MERLQGWIETACIAILGIGFGSLVIISVYAVTTLGIVCEP